MSYQSLYRRYRPQRFGELQGQEHVANALRNAVRNDTVLHAYLFSGPRGTGKTSSARILAKALNCTNLQDGEPCCECESCVQVVAGSSMDVIELDAASNNGVDAMRDLVARAALGTAGRRKVYIVDEVHMLSTAAANALLKTLEEPPDHVVFVLATTDPQKVLQTIISRTQHFEFRLAALDTLTAHLHNVASDAGIELDPDTISQVARKGNGSFRDALSALDQVAALGHLDQAAGNLEEILGAVASRDAAGVLGSLGAVIDQGRDPRQVVRDLVGVLRECFLSLLAPGSTARASESAADLGKRLGTPLVVRCIEVLGEAGVAMRDALDPRVTLEVALVKLVRPDLDASVGSIMARLDALEANRSAGAASGGTGPAMVAPSGPQGDPQVDPASGAAPASNDAVRAHAAPEEPVRHLAVVPDVGGDGSSDRPLDRPVDRPADRSPDRGAARPGERGTVQDARAMLSAKLAKPGSRPAAPSSGTSPTAPNAATAPSSPAPAVPSSPSDTSLSGVKDGWMAAIDNRMTRAMFNAGRFISVTDAEAVYALPNDMTLQRCSEKLADASSALTQLLGRTVQLNLVVDQGGGSIPDDPEGAGQPRQRSDAAASPAGAARSAIKAPSRPAAERSLPGPDDALDVSELTDVPEVSPVDAILSAFPGTEIIEG